VQTQAAVRNYCRAGKPDQAAAIITNSQPLVNRRCFRRHGHTLTAMIAVSDLDQLYARMLLGNRHYRRCADDFPEERRALEELAAAD